MSRPPKSDTAEAKPNSGRRNRPKKAAQALVQAIEDGAECISHTVEDLVEKLAPYPMQDG